MKFTINGLAYSVVAHDVIDSADPETVGVIVMSKAEIQLLRTVPLAVAMRTLAHEVGHAWLGYHPEERLPGSIEAFCESFADVMPAFVMEFNQQGGLVALAEIMGVPHEGDIGRLAAIEWERLKPEERQHLIIRYVLCGELTDQQFETYRALYEAAGLNPLLGDCFPRKSVRNTPHGKVIAVELGTTIKSMRRLAHRTGQLDGISAPEWAGDDLVWMAGWPKSRGHPSFARVAVHRKDASEPFVGVARWESFVQTTVIDGVEMIDPFWEEMDDHMLAKCAQQQALAMAFTQLDGLFINGQMRSPLATSGQAKAMQRPKGQAFPNKIEEKGLPPAIAAPKAAPEDKWIAVMRRAAPAATSRELNDLLLELKESAGTFEDENPEGFERAICDEARKRFGRRR